MPINVSKLAPMTRPNAIPSRFVSIQLIVLKAMRFVAL